MQRITLKHIASGELKQSKATNEDVSLGNWLVKEEKEKRSQNLVFYKTKENDEMRGF